MLLNKPILSFFIIFIISFTVLKFFNFGLNETYNKIIVDAGNVFARNFINENKELKRVFQLIYKKETAGKEFILIGVGNTDIRTPEGQIAMFGMQVEYSSFAYFPLILLVSLIIASPIPLLRRMLALIGGLTTIHIYFLLKIIIILLYAKDFDLTLALGWGESMRSIINYLYDLLIVNTPTGTSILYCLLIWILITFKKNDFERYKSLYSGIIATQQPTIQSKVEIKEDKTIHSDLKIQNLNRQKSKRIKRIK